MNEEVLAPMLGSSPIPEEQSRFCLLQSIRNKKFPQDNRWAERFKTFSDFKRMIYWADQPDGGVGVSFVDPVEYSRLVHCTANLNNAGFLSSNGHCGNSQKDILNEIFNGAKVTTISSEAASEIEQELSIMSREALHGYRWQWQSAYQLDGNRVDDVLIGWSLPEPPPKIDYDWEGEPFIPDYEYYGYDTYPYDPFDRENGPQRNMIPNDFTNIPFNYAFLHSIVSDNLLIQKIAGCKFFTDGQLVDTRFGYYSPAYALALLQSLQKRDLVNEALKSFSNFVHYHPVDPITTLCDRIARQAFRGVVCGHEINNARDKRHHYSMIDRFVEAEDDERDYRRL